MKIRPGAKLFHADGWTDMTKLTAAFRNFANAPKNRRIHCPLQRRSSTPSRRCQNMTGEN